MESCFDKYLVIWWKTDKNGLHISKPVDYESAISTAMAISNDKKFFYEDGVGDLDDWEVYGDWSVVVTKYQPLLEKDLYDELCLSG